MNQLPLPFLDKLKIIIPEEKYENVLYSFEKEKPISFRANTLKITADELQKKLEHRKFLLERVSW